VPAKSGQQGDHLGSSEGFFGGKRSKTARQYVLGWSKVVALDLADACGRQFCTFVGDSAGRLERMYENGSKTTGFVAKFVHPFRSAVQTGNEMTILVPAPVGHV